VVSDAPLRIYTGMLGQIGDIVMFSAALRRMKELFPNGRITLAVSERYRAAGELLEGLSYVDRLFVTRLYFERLGPALFQPWERGYPVDLRGEDEIAEEARHDLVFNPRPRHDCPRWWAHRHQVEETARMIGLPPFPPAAGRHTEIRVPAEAGSGLPEAALGKIVLHNDPRIDPRKAWSWDKVSRFVAAHPPGDVVLLGHPGPEVPGALDLRGRTTLAQAAAVIRDCRAYVGIDSGLLWIAGSLQVPVVGIYGTAYIPNPAAIQPHNPHAVYLECDGPAAGVPTDDVLSALLRLSSPGT
jgi:hypothetical protein